MDEWDALGPGMKIDRRATDWGLVSLWIGGCFLVMAPIMLTFNLLYWTHGVAMHQRGEIEIARLAVIVVGSGFLALIVFGLIAAFRSMGLARASSQPAALAVGGLLTCGLDLILWLALGADLLAIMGTFE
ncbi:MAG TPA: hypothetical protein VKE40_20860 [Gemmataceae bacterium]|nr:hypothetical protein [Gemmataceae bacterium]